MPKRLQDKIGFLEAQNHAKVSNIGSSWPPKSRQVALKIKVKNHSSLNAPKLSPDEMKWWFLASTGGNPPGSLAKAKWAQKLRMRYED